MPELIVRQMIVVREAIARLRKGETRQGMVEYALILACLAILVIVALQFRTAPCPSSWTMSHARIAA
jgi:Flp pilus assembly pilin Flp